MNNKIHDLIHRQIVQNLSAVENWFKEVRAGVDIPIYSSFDVRDSGCKVTNVDGNVYPAGFNNICSVDKENTADLVKYYLDRHYGGKVRKILLLTEEHTSNLYYWDNIATLEEIFKGAGCEVRVAIPRSKSGERITVQSASGKQIAVDPALFVDGLLQAKDFTPDLVISNNDFSDFYQEWGSALRSSMNPPRELGWYQRKKSRYFKHYNELAAEFCKVIDIDPWHLTVATRLFENFDMSDEASRESLVEVVAEVFADMRAEYARRKIEGKPSVFIKNNAGTYGLAVMRVESEAEIRELNYKTRKKMKAAKGGREVAEVIVQEGVPTSVVYENVTAEPAIYLLGCQLAGGFLRTHSEKSATESLNSPGAVYRRLCVSDLKISVEGHPLENVYGWVAKLGLLAIGREAREMNVHYVSYQR